MSSPPTDEPTGADMLEAAIAARDGTATAEHWRILNHPAVKAEARRANQQLRPVVQRAKRDLLNRHDFVRPRCEARPQYGRRRSRGRAVRHRGSRRTAAARGDPDEPPGRDDEDDLTAGSFLARFGSDRRGMGLMPSAALAAFGSLPPSVQRLAWNDLAARMAKRRAA